MQTLSPAATLRESSPCISNCHLNTVILTPNSISEQTVQTELATKARVQEILSLSQTANAAVSTATSNVLEYGAIAATQLENAVQAHHFVDTACANFETAQFQLHPRAHLHG